MGAEAALFGLNAGLNFLNNGLNVAFGELSRQRNYYYGEKQAANADARTRALYKDFYSPQALMKQYKEAGLSPSVMYGGTPGQGGISGAMAPSAAVQTPYMPMSMLEAAQAANLMADTQKKKEEAKNISKDTDLKEIQEKMSNMTLGNEQIAWDITNSTWTNPETGQATSLFEMAEHHYSYESFLEDIRHHENEIDPTIYRESQTEQGQKVLRSIYEGASRFNRDISVLSEEQVSANFQLAVINKLNEENYAEQNAKTALAQLRSLQATSELTETQKDAWNNLINKLDKSNGTMKDIIVVLGMILGNFASHTGIKVNLGK